MADIAYLFGFSSSSDQPDNITKCSEVWELLDTAEKCHFVRNVEDCRSGEALFDYVDLMYCHWGSLNFLTLTAVFILCGSLVCILAGSYVTPALVHLKERLKLDEIKAGATLLTLGNGLPDIMGAITAVQIGHEGLVVGEVLGGTLFVIGVIVGSLYTVGKNAPLGQGFGWMLTFFSAAVLFVGHTYCMGAVTMYHIVAGAFLYVCYYIFIFTMPSYKDDYEQIADDCQQPHIISDQQLPCYVKMTSSLNSSDFESSASCQCDTWLSILTWTIEVLCSMMALPFALLIPAVPSCSRMRVCDFNQVRFFLFPSLFVFTSDIVPVEDNIILFVCIGLLSAFVYKVALWLLSEQVIDTVVTFAGFVLGLCFLHRLTAELVAVVRAMGLYLKLTDEVMGLSILTYGNFVGDVSTYVAVVKRGCLQMALTGCISSVLMSLLFNITLAFSIRFAMTGVWFCPLARSPVTTVLMGGVVLCPVFLLFLAVTFRFHSSVSSGLSLLAYYFVIMGLLIYIQL